MATRTISRAEPRNRLSRERVLQAALAHADAGGLEALTMRRLADELGVAPMALYRHVANRDDLIDGLIDLVFGEIERPAIDAAWRVAMRRRGISLYEVLMRHRWAIGLMEARANPGPANLLHHDAVIGNLRAAGFDLPSVAHAYSLLDGYIYGFALTKMNIPFVTQEDIEAVTRSMLEPFPTEAYPNLVAFVEGHVMKPGYDFADEFEYGLDLILDGLKRVRKRHRPPRDHR